MKKKLFSLIIPVYQNEDNLNNTIPVCIELLNSLDGYEYEFILVNDGSSDMSPEILEKYQSEFPDLIKVVSLTKNFGQNAATIAGITYAKGDVIGVISADLQDPVELFKVMLVDWEKGKKLVIAAREMRSDGFFSDFLSKAFYLLTRKFAAKNYPRGGFDFWLMDRSVVKEYLSIANKNSGVPMSIFQMGFDYALHPYSRAKRLQGKSQYTFWKKIHTFYDTFLANSYAPIRIVSILGFFSSFCALFYTGSILLIALLTPGGEVIVKGWASIVALITFFSGIILMALGTIGEYIWRIYDLAKKTPNFVIENILDDTKKR